MRSCLVIAGVCSPAGKGVASWLLCVMFYCVTLTCGVLGQVCYLIVSIPDLCPLTYFHCFHTVYHEDWISVLGTDRRQDLYQENIGDEEGFQIRIHS